MNLQEHTKKTLSALEEQAFGHRKKGEWIKARQCYEQVLTFEVTEMKRAETLAAIMQMYDNQSSVSENDDEEYAAEAVGAGTAALEIVEGAELYKTPEGKRLQGYLKSRLTPLDVEVKGGWMRLLWAIAAAGAIIRMMRWLIENL